MGLPLFVLLITFDNASLKASLTWASLSIVHFGWVGFSFCGQAQGFRQVLPSSIAIKGLDRQTSGGFVLAALFRGKSPKIVFAGYVNRSLY